MDTVPIFAVLAPILAMIIVIGVAFCRMAQERHMNDQTVCCEQTCVSVILNCADTGPCFQVLNEYSQTPIVPYSDVVIGLPAYDQISSVTPTAPPSYT